MARFVWLALLLTSACTSEHPCAGVSGVCYGFSPGATDQQVQKALIEAAPGSTIAFGAGTFHFAADLSLDVDNVTIQGAGMNKTILSFAKQSQGQQGLIVMANGFAIHDLAIEDTPGNALKILGAQGVTIERTRVEWTRGPDSNNGGYGLYPVQCSNVLIDSSVVKGASDSGVYVGQSNNIVVSNNDVELNVAGIEIENSTSADVHDNVATQNTGGILVFSLPNLQIENGQNTRVFNNMVYDNNTPNFAPAGNIVGMVPTGTGLAVLAAHHVEYFGNNVHDHNSVNFGIISYVPTMIAVTDTKYDQYPTALYIHDNMFSGVSNMPTGQLGGLLISALGELYPSGPFIVPDIAWDGVLDPARVQSATGDYADADKICIQHNSDGDPTRAFINLEYPLNGPNKPSTDLTPHNCTHPALPAVTLP